MAQTDTPAIRGLTAIPGERTHHGFETLRPIGAVATRIFSQFDARPIVPALGATELQSLDSRFLGQEVDLIAKYVISPRSNILFGYSHFWRGDKILAPKDADFAYSQWEVNF